MSGYINLYGPALRQKKPLVSAAQALPAAVAVIVVLMGWAVFARQDANRSEDAAQAADVQLKARKERLTALTQAAAARRPDAALSAQLAQAESVLAGRNAVLARLEEGGLGGSSDFSQYMRAFARQSVDGLWLTGFDIVRGGAEMAISGRALDAELLPQYIRRLKGEPVFQGREFATLTMGVAVAEVPVATEGKPETGATAEPYLEFSLASARAPAMKELAK